MAGLSLQRLALGLTTPAAGGGTPSLALSASTVAEDAADETVIGTLSVNNPPDGVTYTYAVTSDPSSNFDTSSDDLIVAIGATLDYETATSHTIEITATGSDASEIVRNFTITVTDVIESLLYSGSLVAALAL